MKSIVSFGCILLLLISFSANAQTNISGYILSNTTWTLAGSPYMVTGNTLVSNGVTLTIEPGVVVKFDDSTAIQIDGELIAIGTPQNRITFTSMQAVPAAGDWGKIHFPGVCTDAVFDSLGRYISGSIMKYCDVLYGGELGFGQIHIESSSPYFSHCNISSSSKSGIYCHGSAYFLDSSSIKNCSSHGLYFDDHFKNSCGLDIRNNTIENNKGGIYFGSESRPVSCLNIPVNIINNNFSSNYTFSAIEVYSTRNMKISENNFINN